MSKFLIYSESSDYREILKKFLGDHYELILTDSIENVLDILKHSNIKSIITDKPIEIQRIVGNTPIKIIPIVRPLKEEDILNSVKE